MTNSKQLFFQELKDEYNAQFALSDALEGKSGQLITVCGIFIPLLFGFSSLIFDNATADPIMTIYLTILLVLSISLAVLSIFFCTWALGIRSYTHAFLPDSFLVEKKQIRNWTIKPLRNLLSGMRTAFMTK